VLIVGTKATSYNFLEVRFFMRAKGFTLAELLIALAILGVIATFTIPKILSATSSGQNTAVAKEAASMISGAFSNYSLTYGISATTTAGAMTGFMNYVSTTNTGTIGSLTCTATDVCLKLHNGGALQYSTSMNFNGTAATNGIYFNIDPDGTGTVATQATFVQFANGRLSTLGVGTATSGGTALGGTTTTDPSYIANWN
jgi:prepilin-type N-terminal cleavage/methylation domain-containing protein